MALAEMLEQTRSALADAPGAGAATFRTTASLVGVTEVDVKVRSHRFKMDEPTNLGGGDVAANPVEYLLSALAGCHAISYRVWSETLGIPFDDVRITVEGDLDVRGFFGVDETVRPGCNEIRLDTTLRGPESLERYEQLHAAVVEHCPVQDMLEGAVLKTEFRVG